MSELKPCPFCGASHSYQFAYTEGVKEVQIRYSHKSCPLEAMWFTVEQWNTRATDPRLIEAVKEIETMGRNCMKGDVRKDGLLLALYIFEKHFPELKEAKDE